MLDFASARSTLRRQSAMLNPHSPRRTRVHGFRSRRLAWPALALGLWLAACSEDQARPCQNDRDCASGLICAIGIGNQRGICELPTVDEAQTDRVDRDAQVPAQYFDGLSTRDAAAFTDRDADGGSEGENGADGADAGG
ncbi:MAG: hypothetical protein OEZ06_28855 [Myxococcales bacterium]|nr:hypothetical protein [Myxococcales bacterium]